MSDKKLCKILQQRSSLIRVRRVHFNDKIWSECIYAADVKIRRHFQDKNIDVIRRHFQDKNIDVIRRHFQDKNIDVIRVIFVALILYMSCDMRFPTMWYVQLAKAQTSLHICAV